jgi:hypothetical protein
MTDEARLGRLERFKLGKGITQENGDGQWIREYVEVEVKLPENASEKDLVANFTATEYLIDQLLQPPKTAAPAEKKPAQPQVAITMAPEEIDKLPWIASHWVRKDDNKDRNARHGEDAWIKLENSDSRLIRMLDESQGKLELPPYTFEYKEFADSGQKIIVRRGPKAKKK